MNRSRLLAFFVFLGLFAAVFQLGSLIPVAEEDANLFLGQFRDLVSDIDAIGIFAHNLRIALPMFIPGAGAAWGLVSAASTGFAFAAIGAATGQALAIPPLALLFLSPFGLMEVTAYSIATSRSFVLIWALAKKTAIGPMIKPTIIEVGIVAALLLAGAYVEFYIIEHAIDDFVQALVLPLPPIVHVRVGL